MTPAIVSFDVAKHRQDFPILSETVHGKPLAYLDNAATTQKPRLVIDAVTRFYRQENANIHRGIHALSEHATASYEAARSKVQQFLNAREAREIIFVRGATEGINLVAQTYGRANLKAGDEILITELEHHANIVPWQMLCEQLGATLQVVPVNDQGEVTLEAFTHKLTPQTKLVALAHVSNALGTILPARQMIQAAHRQGAVVLVDGAQSVPHLPVDVQALDADFFVFSGHKVFAPTGIGVVYGKANLLETMPPYQGGGDMIQSVSFSKTTYNDIPLKFEAGTPHIAGVIGLGAAIDYLQSVGLTAIAAYEQTLLSHATHAIQAVPGITLIGTAPEKACILSFVMATAHPHDIGTILDREGVAIRTGHHCAMPLMERFHIPATARASFAFYNTLEEVDQLIQGLHKVKEWLG